MGPLVALLAQAGIQLGTHYLSQKISGDKRLADISWGGERVTFAKNLREQLEEQRVESQSAFRLEAQRAGLASAGAYLAGMAEIEKGLDEIFGRQMSEFEIRQIAGKRSWRQEQARFAAQQEGWGERIGRIGGQLSAIPLAMYQHEQTENITQRMEELYSQIPENKPATGQLNAFNQFLADWLIQGYGMPKDLGNLLRTFRASSAAQGITPEPLLTPLPPGG
jgi:hypothetical protein